MQTKNQIHQNRRENVWVSHLFCDIPNNEKEQSSHTGCFSIMFCIPKASSHILHTENVQYSALFYTHTYQGPFGLREELSELRKQILLSPEQICHFSEHFFLRHASERPALRVQLFFLTTRDAQMLNRVKNIPRSARKLINSAKKYMLRNLN